MSAGKSDSSVSTVTFRVSTLQGTEPSYQIWYHRPAKMDAFTKEIALDAAEVGYCPAGRAS